jgi:RPA family protein
MAENQQNQKRQVAYKVSVKEILDGNYIKEEGWNPNYLTLKDGRQISRVNIIGTIIEKQKNESSDYKNITLDDGSAEISLRLFDNSIDTDKFNIGDPIMIIGRVREFGNERYILPEIIKNIENIDWISLRLLELNRKIEKKPKKLEIYDVKEEVIEEDKGIISIIRKLDSGDGADFNEVIKRSKDPNAEKVLNNLIKIGELFEIKPGKIKVLE